MILDYFMYKSGAENHFQNLQLVNKENVYSIQLLQDFISKNLYKNQNKKQD